MNAATATVTTGQPVTVDLPVTLSSSDRLEIGVSTPIVIIRAGTTSATFQLNAVDDDLVYGTQAVTLLASASGATAVVTSISVTDDEDPPENLSTSTLFEVLLTSKLVRNMLPVPTLSRQMAAKSSKNPLKKVPEKKVPDSQKKSKTAPALPDAPAIEVEVIVDAPNLIPPEVLEKILEVEKKVGEMAAMTDEDVVDEICGFVAEAEEFSRLSIKYGSWALVSAWGCGTFLNAAKKKLGPGAFGEWRKSNFVDSGFSERSSTRYMKLASRCSDIRALLESGAGLRQAYIASGVLPEPSPAEQTEEKKNAPDREIFLTGLTNFQRHLWMFEKALAGFDKSKVSLSEEDKKQLHLMKDEISKFTDRILKLLP